MQLVGTQVIPEQGGKRGFTVEFVGSGGEVVSVLLRHTSDRSLTAGNAVDRARAIMSELAASDPSDGADGDVEALRSARQAGDAERWKSNLTRGWKIRFRQATRSRLRRLRSRPARSESTEFVRCYRLDG